MRRSPTDYVVRVDASADYAALFEALLLDGLWPTQIAHLWGVDTPSPRLIDRLRKHDPTRIVARAVGEFYVSQLCVVQAVMEQERPVVLSTVASGLYSTSNEDAPPDPMKAMLVGPNRVAPREAPHVRSRCIDLALGNVSASVVAARLRQELERGPSDTAVALRPATRLVRGLDFVPLDPAAQEPPTVRERATIVISGGLSGIGLEVAEHLAVTARARLVLVGRTAVPDRSDWAALARGAGRDRAAVQARKLLAIEAAGGEVLPVKADVTDIEEMTGVVALARARFGAIHGVIHSAGVIDDGLISLKTPSAPTPVITVKACGALVLDDVLRDEPLDFFIVFSSISSVLGLEGQVDYTSANAFLDAFIERMRRAGRVRALSIGWNAWREIGMTALLADGAVHPAARLNGRPGPHPDLERVTEEPDGSIVYSTLFSCSRQWLLAEHVVRGGDALIPGTGYLELAQAAMPAPRPGMVTELRDVTFLSPFIVARSAPRLLRVRLAPDRGGSREFAFLPEGDDEPSVMGQIAQVTAEREPTAGLAAIHARLGTPVRVGGFLAQPFMAFGPRWENVVETAARGTEALVHLALPAEFHDDLATYRLHPALMDMATGGAQLLIPGFDQSRDFFVPFNYGRLRLFDGLTPELYSHVRYDAAGSDADTARFDIDLYSAAGTVLVEVRGFTMKRLGAGAALNRGRTEEAAPLSASQANLRELLRLAIEPTEGMDAFDRIVASGLQGHILASSVDLPRWLVRLERDAGHRRDLADGTEDASTGFARPDLATSFVGPRNGLEQELCEMWKQLLGLTDIGIHDDFFELGGQSLVAVRLFSRIRKRYQVDLPLSTLFEAPTIAQCAAIIAQEAGLSLTPLSAATPAGDDVSAVEESVVAELVSVEPAPDRAASRWRSLVVMQSKGAQPPFVCVAGMGGTLNNLRKLAILLGDTRPFYGMQPPGAEDPSQLLESVEELAAHYISELRREQPHGPYYLGGYSGGGVAAFEMARQLMLEGEEVAFLGFIDSFSPALPHRTLSERVMLHARRVARIGPRYLFDMLRRRVGAERGNLRLRLARRLGRVMPDEYRYDAIGASWIAAEARYKPEAQPLHGTLFRAREESAVSLWSGVKVDGEHGWGRYLLGGIDVQLCPGNHTTMCEEPNVRVLATRVRASIEVAAASHDGRKSVVAGAASH